MQCEGLACVLLIGMPSGEPWKTALRPLPGNQNTTEAANGRATFALVNVRSLSFTLRDTDIQCEQMPV